MRTRSTLFVQYYCFFVLFFVVQKVVFMLSIHRMLEGIGINECLAVLWHGLPLDLSVAGYISLLFGLLLVGSAFLKPTYLAKVADIYTAIVLLVAICAFLADTMLFPYWGFHIDKTVFFYLQNPRDAMASVLWWQYIVGIGGMAGLWLICFYLYKRWLSPRFVAFSYTFASGRQRARVALAMLLLTAALLLPIRGGVSVSVMNTGKVYFSEKQLLNLCAVNPIFHCIESLSEDHINSAKYHYMPTAEADSIVSDLLVCADTTAGVLRVQRPKNIVWVIMESMSANVMGALNEGVGVTPALDSIMAQGILFENAYSSSFRTDRGVVAVLSAFPGQPTSSLMMVPQKSQHLPFVSRTLAQEGYASHFFYGGDEDFTNMRSYLVAGNIMDRVSDRSFPVSQRLSKWGVQDAVLLDYAAQAITTRKDTGRHFDIILTLSSHEPFDVPTCRYDAPYLNAVAYTDSAMGVFIDRLKEGLCWDSTLLVLVADHGYAYPQGVMMSSVERYKILMYIGGGAVNTTMRYAPPCQQIDLVATVLSEMGLNGEDYAFSRNIFTKQSSYVFFSYNDGFVLLTASDTTRVDGTTGRVESGAYAHRAKAYMQQVYTAIDGL